MSVFMSVTKVNFSDYGQIVRVLFLLSYNRVGIYGSKDFKSKRASKLHHQFKSYDNYN